MLNIVHHHNNKIYELSSSRHLWFITDIEYQEALEELQIFFEKRIDRLLYPNKMNNGH